MKKPAAKKKRAVVKKTVTLQPDVWEFVLSRAKGNISRFINEVLQSYHARQLTKDMMEGYQAMAADPKLAEDIKLWDTALADK